MMFKKLVVGLAMILMVGCATGSAITVPKEIPNVSQIHRYTPEGKMLPECGDRICFTLACINIVSEAHGIMNKYHVLIHYVDTDDDYLPDYAVVFVQNPVDGFWYLLTEKGITPEEADRLVNAYNLNFRTCRNM
jgi:hypothetical protein